MMTRRLQPLEALHEHSFDSTRLWVSDFDGTQAATFEPAPTGIGVSEAYEMSIHDLYGEASLEKFIMQGGHNNRTPAEIVLGVRPGLGPDELDTETERLVSTKLDILLAQVGLKMPDGELWPRPVPGFLDTWNAVQEVRLQGRRIDTAGISAGHQEFILRTFELWDVPSPDMLVTEETVRSLRLSIPPEETAKPRPFQMQLVEMQWMARHAILRTLGSRDWNRIIYTGDDLSKDGGLAKNSHVRFFYIDPDGQEESWAEVSDHLFAAGSES